MSNPEINFYQVSSNRNQKNSFSKGENPTFEKIQTQVCVMGGGIAGLSSAIELRLLGYEVVLLEQKTIGSGASGQNGGQAIVDVACGMTELASIIGEESAKTIFKWTVEGLQIIRDRVKDYQIDCDLTVGTITAAQKKRHDKEVLSMEKAYRSVGHEVEVWDTARTRSEIDTELYTSALYDPNGLHIHPLNYTLGLARVAQDLGVKIYENTRVVKYTDGEKVVIETERVNSDEEKSANNQKNSKSGGLIEADRLVLAGNVGNNINSYLGSRIMPVGTYIAATRPLGKEMARRLIKNNAAICDMNFALDYYRFSADDRLLFGGRVSYSGRTPNNLKKSLYDRLLLVFPEFKKYQAEEIFEYSWGGFVDITMNRAPHFGNVSEKVYFLQGFSGHGVALTNVAGRVVAEAIDHDIKKINGKANETTRLDLFKTIPHQRFWGGKLLRTPSLVLGMAYYRLIDKLK